MGRREGRRGEEGKGWEISPPRSLIKIGAFATKVVRWLLSNTKLLANHRTQLNACISTTINQDQSTQPLLAV